MIEKNCDAWSEQCDALCVTTNGFTKTNGAAVMGRGIAKQAKTKIYGIEKVLGKLLKEQGNHVYELGSYNNTDILSFPTKNVWWENSDLQLIEQSTKELVDLVNKREYKKVLLPRPGCSNGKLSWEQVKPIIEPYLDNRFVIITNGT